MRIKAVLSRIVLAGLLASGATQAALIDRGGGLIYDNVLNITWLGDANYAKTSGYDADGRMNWNAATAWAGNLSFYDNLRNVTYTDWRLAANTPVGTNWNFHSTKNGSTDLGYNITSPHSELSYMYYVNLGFKGYYSPAGAYQPNFGIFGNGSIGSERDNLGPNGAIDNLQSDLYWSGTVLPPNPAGSAWGFFYTSFGYQYYGSQGNEVYAWAVRPGDVAAISEPESYVLLLTGLGLLTAVAKRRRLG